MRYLVRFEFGLSYAFGEEVQLLTSQELQFLKDNIGTKIYLGEIDGKHSEVNGTLEYSDFKILAEYEEDNVFVKEFDRHFNQGFGIDIFSALVEAVNEEDYEEEEYE